MKDWQKLSQKTQAIGYRTITFKKYTLPDGKEAEFTTYGPIGTNDVAVIALTPDKQVLIARQFRPGPEKVLDELPGGIAEAGEDLAAAAQRELLEETGYRPAKMEYLGATYRDAYSNATSHYFIAYDCTKVAGQQLDDNEFVEVMTISIEQLIDNARQGNMTDAAVVGMSYELLRALAA